MKYLVLILFSLVVNQNSCWSQSIDTTYFNYLKGIVFENKPYEIIDIIPKTRSQYSIFYSGDSLSVNRFFEIQQEIDEYVVKTNDTLYVQYYLLLAEFADGYVADVYFGWLERAIEENPLVKYVFCSRIKQENEYVFKRLSYLFDNIEKDDN